MKNRHWELEQTQKLNDLKEQKIANEGHLQELEENRPVIEDTKDLEKEKFEEKTSSEEINSQKNHFSEDKSANNLIDEKVFSIPFPVPSNTAFAITKRAIENEINKIITSELFREIIFLKAYFSVNIYFIP